VVSRGGDVLSKRLNQPVGRNFLADRCYRDQRNATHEVGGVILRFSRFSSQGCIAAQPEPTEKQSMAKDRGKILNQIIRKIPLFSGLSPSQIDILLKVCQAQPYAAGDVVCAIGTTADEMYILLSGELAVVTEDGTRVATLSPVTTVGELGLVTQQNRRATVETLSASNLLIIRKMSFEVMLQSNLEIQARILRNIVDIVAHKITDDNIRTSEHVKVTDRLERQVRELEHRVTVSTVMLVEETGAELAQVRLGIDKRMLEQ
jgi:CRP-like cAMP-binding protein